MVSKGLALREFQQGGRAFARLLNYDALVAEGVLLNQDGSLTACLYYSGPDLDSLPPEERSALAAYVNDVLCTLGTGWTVNVDVLRIPAIDYPSGGHFPDVLSYLIEEERRAHYQQQEAHFEATYVLTLTWLPEQSSRKLTDKALNRLKKVLQTKHDEADVPSDTLPALIEKFNLALENFTRMLSARLTAHRLNSKELLTFLHECITGRHVPLHVPEFPWMLNHYLGAYEFTGGIAPKIDTHFIGCVGITAFPHGSYAGMLASLASMPFAYRFSTRFIVLDQTEALGEIRKLRDSLHNKQFDVMSLIGLAFNTSIGQSSYRNEEALEKASDAATAMNEARDGAVKYGYLTSVLVIYDTDQETLKQKLHYVKKRLDNSGFPARIEEMNAVEAYLGTLPAHIYANLRRPLLHTLNLAQLMPLGTIWAGEEYSSNPNLPTHSAPLFYGKTTGSTPYRFDLYVGDVGHTAVFGPTGAGKSVFLGLAAAQFLRYAGAQVFTFEKGRSQYALGKACSADHYDIQGDAAIALCPLGRVNEPQEQAWACDWMEDLLLLQGVTITPEMRNLIAQGMATLGKSKSRTLSDFYNIVQDTQVRDALASFTAIKDGKMAGLLDARQDGLSDNHFQVFELEHLMNMAPRTAVPVLLYLFHAIERRLDGRPTLIVLDEAWLMLEDELFREKIREWLKVLRKANAAVIFATQNLSDVMKSPIADVILESCQTQVFLPNARARTPEGRKLYEEAGLNSQQIAIISQATPKQHYYVTSPRGQRLIELGMGELALAFLSASNPQAIHDIRQLEAKHGSDWPVVWMERQGLHDWAQSWMDLTAHEEAQAV